MTRKVFGRSAVEKGTREQRVLKNHQLDSFYKGCLLNLKQKAKKTDELSDSGDTEVPSVDNDGLVNITRPAVVCSDVIGLFEKVQKY